MLKDSSRLREGLLGSHLLDIFGSWQIFAAFNLGSRITEHNVFLPQGAAKPPCT